MKRVYLDYAATTPVAPEVEKAMRPYFGKIYGNPMALHHFGQITRQAIEQAREEVAGFFGLTREEMVFTSGATESNNLAVKGVVKAVAKRFGKDAEKTVPHVVTTAFEHHCLLDSAKSLLAGEEAEVTFLRPRGDGLVDPATVRAAIKPNTVLVSVMYVNNEIGTILPLREIGKIVARVKSQREEMAQAAGKQAWPIYYHSDVTQGVYYLPCDARALGLDLLSFSAHKIYGPKGVGGLGVRKGTFIRRIQDGGGQEFGLRPGTHNVPGIVGLAQAIGLIGQMGHMGQVRKIEKLRDYFWGKLRKEVNGIKLNGSLEKRVANNLNISFDGVEGESLLLALDIEGVACSTGSACSSENLEPSHVLLAIGKSHPEAHGSLRFSLGEGTTREDIDYTVEKIIVVVDKLRKISGFKT